MDIRYAAVPIILIIIAAAVLIGTKSYSWPPSTINDCKNFPVSGVNSIGNCYSLFLPPVNNCTGGAACLGGLAVERNDSTLCTTIQDSPTKDGCLYIVSLNKNNTADCTIINDSAVRSKCYSEPNITIAGGGGGSTDQGVNTPSPGIDAAPPETPNLTTLCVELSTPALRSQCFTNAAIANKNPLYCEGTDGTYVSSGLTFYYKYSCYYYSSLAALTPEYCSRILIPVDYINQDECMQLAQG